MLLNSNHLVTVFFFYRTCLIHSPPIWVRSVVMGMSVCLHVCPLAYLKNRMSIPTKFSVRATCSHGSVFLWWQCNTLCNSGFVDEGRHVTIIMSLNGCRLASIVPQCLQSCWWPAACCMKAWGEVHGLRLPCSFLQQHVLYPGSLSDFLNFFWKSTFEISGMGFCMGELPFLSPTQHFQITGRHCCFCSYTC